MKLAAILLLTLLGLVAVLWGIDFAVVSESLSAFDWRSFAVAWVCYYLTQVFRCLRASLQFFYQCGLIYPFP